MRFASKSTLIGQFLRKDCFEEKHTRKRKVDAVIGNQIFRKEPELSVLAFLVAAPDASHDRRKTWQNVVSRSEILAFREFISYDALMAELPHPAQAVESLRWARKRNVVAFFS